MPYARKQAKFALDNTAELPGDCIGALVSLTFNRGPSYLSRPEKHKDGQFREMQEIRSLMRDEDFAAVPARIRSMKRIWQGKPKMRGLLDRREAGAKLFEAGLRAG